MYLIRVNDGFDVIGFGLLEFFLSVFELIFIGEIVLNVSFLLGLYVVHVSE